MEIPSGSEGIKKINWRQFGKHWVVVFVLAILAALIIWSMLRFSPWLRNWQERRLAAKIQRQLEKPYREDKYGGKTPEETYDMFIAALEKNDITLASKYFVLGKQEQWKKTLEEYKVRDLIKDFIDELKSTKNKWKKVNSTDDKTITFQYEVLIENNSVANFNGQKVNIPAGNYTNDSVFTRYPSGVWKISVL